MSGTVAAVDLGATSGRVVLGHAGPGELWMRELARFPNGPVRVRGSLHWNVLELHRQVCAALELAAHEADPVSVGIDSWAVDYALLRGGRMLGTPHHYRDERTKAAVADVHSVIGPAELYEVNGLQHLPFNTIFQLAADRRSGLLAAAERMLLLPDLLAYWLTGEQVAERTNASTTGLLDVRTAEWSESLAARLGHDRGLLPPLVSPGERIGALDTGVPVTAVGSHDTASAVVAVPARDESFAYISCGTWSLVGVELERPLLSEAGRAANFTNELGVDGRIRYLHNVMGLWLLTECVAEWERTGPAVDLPALLAAAAEVPPVAEFDADDPRFLAPGDMPARITAWLTEHDRPVPRDRAEFTRCILESLASAYAESVARLEILTGRALSAVHVVGGGARNELLCRLTAERTGRPVVAGPVEATALGNVLVQARAAGLLTGGLESLRALVRSTAEPRTYRPGEVRAR
ncbi:MULTISPECIES: rhamnulokinase family protein [unclassified Saccharopolyspora]|uniref:rhamnulokinase n=1 Tax=unclassified Saccharopolyspora TaxID=2646250 RepID=UPI001CD68869|nr:MULTISPECIES: rhamnulokinase family protein [unclassified Saccharopolyspora]MCA1187552.1 rhamnulokinase [Saccharopolyspora sp. 6T]MCA1191969.1 rhamnulokinase [Saccharopolyspora sp. 6V]MCA1279763.1 rhamnulokinase [Saccharopolyspora sp. 7B]